MVDAVVMVRTAAGKSEELVESVRGLEHVDEAHVVAGEFDIIAEVKGEEVYDLLHTSSSDIQRLDGIASTKTYVSMD